MFAGETITDEKSPRDFTTLLRIQTLLPDDSPSFIVCAQGVSIHPALSTSSTERVLPAIKRKPFKVGFWIARKWDF